MLGSEIPVAINTFGSYWRVNQALGTSNLESLADRVQQLVKPEMPTTLLEKMKKLPDLIKLGSFPPGASERESVSRWFMRGDDADLTKLPIIQCWPLDAIWTADRSLTKTRVRRSPNAALENTSLSEEFTPATPSPATATSACIAFNSLAPANVRCIGTCTTTEPGISACINRRGEKMPLAIALGGESVLPYAATAPLPPGIEELLFAGFLNDGGIPLVKCKTIDLEVPANAEIIIEGYVDPAETLMEGPFGDHTGFYSLADRYPRFT